MSWPKPQLQEFCRIIQGGRSGLSGNDFVPEGIPAYGAGGLNGYLPTHEFDEPAVILSSIGARCGKCFYAEGKWASLANTQLIFPDTTKADVRFLWIQLNDESRWHRSGTGQPFIKPSDVKTHRVLLPPLAEQRRIAEVLDRAEALRAKRRAALAHLDALTQSLFLDLFGDPATNPKRWPMKQLGDVATEVYRYPAYYGITYEDDGVPEIRGELLNADGSMVTDRTRLRFISAKTSARFPKTVLATGDLVMSVRRTIGKIGLVPPELAGGQITANLIRIALDQTVLDPLFAWNVTQTAFFKQQITNACSSTTILTIKAPDLKRLPVPLPPISLQREFARRVTAVEALKTAQRASLAELDALFATLQHRGFRGEL
ncbi:MAG: restriction endonuclease subunit S [Verrucomicrobia bacterium]|nr:restriction endonuclease subunit S [Verrucomicrobiota bacterium]